MSASQDLIAGDTRRRYVRKGHSLLDKVSDRTLDCLVVPAGPGNTGLRPDHRVLKLVRAHHGEGKLIGALCAAPTVLREIEEQAVVVDGKVLRSRGAGTAVEFGLAPVVALMGSERAAAVASNIHFGEGRSPHHPHADTFVTIDEKPHCMSVTCRLPPGLEAPWSPLRPLS